MKTCVICKKEIAENGDVCESCLDFFKWKYKKNFQKKISEFRKIMKDTSSIKARRLK